MGACVRARPPCCKADCTDTRQCSLAGKKKNTPSDESKIKLLYPDHVRVLIGDLSEGVAETDGSDEEMSEAEEEAEEEDSEEVCEFHLKNMRSRVTITLYACYAVVCAKFKMIPAQYWNNSDKNLVTKKNLLAW